MKKSQWNYRKSYRIKKTRRFWRNKIFWFIIAFSFVIGGMIYFFVFSSFFQIQSIEILGLRKIPKEDFQKIVENNIRRNILIFSSKSIFVADFGEIAREAFGNFPQLDEIKIKRNLPNAVIVDIEEKKPAAILFLKEKRFFLDKKGIIFEAVAKAADELPKITTDGLDEDLKLGREIISQDRLLKIIDVDNKLKSDLRLQVDAFDIAAPEKLIVNIKDGWEFYLNLEGDIDWQLTKLSALLEEKIPPENRGNLEYIELRFGNLAPYKYKIH